MTTRTPRRRTAFVPSGAVQTVTLTPHTPETHIYDAIATNLDNMEAIREIKAVLFEYANILKRTIYFENAHGEYTRESKQGEDLYLYFWCNPEGEYRAKKYHHVFGLTLQSYQEDGCEIETTSNSLILTDPSELGVMQVVQSTIYIPFDLPHRVGGNTSAILRALMDLYMENQLTPEEVEMRKKVAETKAEAAVPEVVSKLISGQYKAEIDQLNRNLESFENYIKQYQEGLLDKIKGASQVRQKLSDIEKRETNRPERIARELTAIKKLKQVKRVTTRGDKLLVQTETIFISTEVGKYQIGEFTIAFGPGGEFKLSNKHKVSSGSRSNLDHPHVLDGSPCLGNMYDMMTYVNQGEIAMATQLAVTFLQSYEPTGAYAPIDLWECVEKFVAPTQEGKPVAPEEDGVHNMTFTGLPITNTEASRTLADALERLSREHDSAPRISTLLEGLDRVVNT